VRRHRRLLDEALTWPAVLAAARRARRGKRDRSEVLRFHAAEADRLVELREALQQGVWLPQPAKVFHIQHPKPRWISAAPYADRVVHQILCAPLERVLENYLHPFCMANRKGKGVDAALRVARREMRRHSHVLCLDVQAYFGSIDHSILKQQLQRLIKDHHYTELLCSIIDQPTPAGPPMWFDGDDLLAPCRPRGLAIGNLTSQHFGNLFLAPLDHACTINGLRWVRYVDDLLVFGSRQDLIEQRKILFSKLGDLRLRQHPNKTRIQPTTEPLKFLGLILEQTGRVRPPGQSIRRWRVLQGRGLLMRSRSLGR
jgi:RNA-directed DNA polymerase